MDDQQQPDDDDDESSQQEETGEEDNRQQQQQSQSPSTSAESSDSASVVCISLEVPPGAQPGDVLSFVVRGKELEIELTDGVAVGDILQIQISQQEDVNDNDNGDNNGSDAPETLRPDQDDHDDDVSTEQESQDHANGSAAAAEHQEQGRKKPRFSSEEDAVKHDKAKTTIALPNGKQLQLDHAVPLLQDLDIDKDDASTDFRVGQKQQTEEEEKEAATTTTKNHRDNLACDGTHAMAWPTARVLLQQMDELFVLLKIRASIQQRRQEHCPLRILELGSGLGLVGLGVVASLNNNCSSNEKDKIMLTLTDCAAAMPLLRHNVEQNRSIVPPHVNLECKVLDWTSNVSASSSSSSDQTGNDDKGSLLCYSLILASDVLYNVEMIPHLIAVLDQTLEVNHGRVLLAVRWRKPQLERFFFEETTSRLGITWTNAEDLLIPCTIKGIPRTSSSQHYAPPLCNLDWRDFGNPSSPASNKYLQQTMISIQQPQRGSSSSSCSSQLKSLASITEQDTAAMTELEYEMWERAFIQIYIGTRNNNKNSTGQMSAAAAAAAAAATTTAAYN
jgi:predicted nicotinamide N-methyase